MLARGGMGIYRMWNTGVGFVCAMYVSNSQTMEVSMAYEVTKFPFSPTKFAVKVVNPDTGKCAKFFVAPIGQCSTMELGACRQHGNLMIDLRSPTPGFPAKDEMTKAEVMADIEGLFSAVIASL